ncbi:MAG TPA: FAD:protein FMN transferase [Methylophilus sp.]
MCLSLRHVASLLACLLLLSCKPVPESYNTQSYVFGTLIDISVYGETEMAAQDIASDILRDFQSLHNRLHAWKPSDLSAINRNIAQGNSVLIDTDIAQMIRQATEYSSLSGGLFNPAVGQLIKLWGFHGESFTPVKTDPEKIAALVKANPKMSDIVIEGKLLHSTNPAVKLDLGGYAKGYALDIGLRKLNEGGVKHALINIGGNVIALGQHGSVPWRVGIQHPRKPNAIAAVNLESGWAIGTSGDYQRFFMRDGKRYSHLIDPRTGYPAQGTQSVTVLIPPQPNAGVLSDVASKPIFISELSKKAAVAKAMGVEHVMIIQENGDIWLTPAMQKRIEWLDADAKPPIQLLQ